MRSTGVACNFEKGFLQFDKAMRWDMALFGIVSSQKLVGAFTPNTCEVLPFAEGESAQLHLVWNPFQKRRRAPKVAWDVCLELEGASDSPEPEEDSSGSGSQNSDGDADGEEVPILRV